jgi:putative solute:sodium symporter small subunit
VFVVLIFIYSWRMKVLERRFGVDDDEEHSS